MRKIVVNCQYGGFCLSDQAIELYATLSGLTLIKRNKSYYSEHRYFDHRAIPRDDPNLVKVVETLNQRADGKNYTLRIVEIPEDVEWELEEYDGREWVAEKHRKWYPNNST